MPTTSFTRMLSSHSQRQTMYWPALQLPLNSSSSLSARSARLRMTFFKWYFLNNMILPLFVLTTTNTIHRRQTVCSSGMASPSQSIEEAWNVCVNSQPPTTTTVYSLICVPLSVRACVFVFNRQRRDKLSVMPKQIQELIAFCKCTFLHVKYSHSSSSYTSCILTPLRNGCRQ